MSTTLWLLATSLFCLARSAFNLGFADDSDLTSFVTRPDIKAPLWNITNYDPTSLDAGYWFVGPYAELLQQPPSAGLYQSCQTGPHIYDRQGDLVWSGACLIQNRVACDVRAFEANGSSFMSAILMTTANDTKGHGIIMDHSYNIVQRLRVAPGHSAFNMHELTFVEQGSHALYIMNRPEYVDIASVRNNTDGGWILNLGFREVNIASGDVIFEWWAWEHINLSESSAVIQGLNYRGVGWNWLHINSVNKNDDGDYIMSARFTNCIYKISGKDGSILWRLGGKNSSFVLENFNFSRQHDAQWLAYDDDVEVVSFLDNAADTEGYNTSSISSALIVRLDKRAIPPSAIVEQRILRPDQGISQLRGNFQILPNGNRLVGWSDDSYITEHSREGQLLMEARFRSERFVTYRAYKSNFTGFPAEEPVLRAFAYGSELNSSLTVYFVSWNGATEVSSWRFWRDHALGDGKAFIGEAPRTGFETSFSSQGYESSVYAEAISRDGSSLGSTPSIKIFAPRTAESPARGVLADVQRDNVLMYQKDEL